MSTAETVRARIDPELKREASAVLAELGLSVSDAIRILLTRVAAEKALPFEMRVPNAESRAAMRAARDGEVVRHASVAELLDDLEADD